MTPRLIPLTALEPLASQVAAHLLGYATGDVLDLSEIEVWVPSAGAARRIRAALARQAAGRGVFAPVFRQPMQALLEGAESVAGRSEREAAWALAIEAAGHFEELFPNEAGIADDARRLAAGGTLCDLCDLLAEAGRSPADPTVPGDPNQGRWNELRGLYARYLAQLERAGVRDPNAVRLREAVVPRELGQLVIACVPDLPLVAERWAAAQPGASCDVLVWQPRGVPGHFDAWGRPDSGAWGALSLGGFAISTYAGPAAEAGAAVELLAAAQPAGDYGLVVADASCAAAFRAAILDAGAEPFDPAGRRLDATEPGRVAALWAEWRRHQRLSTLGRLLESPAFCAWLAGRSGLAASHVQLAVEELAAVRLCETMDDATEALASAREDSEPGRQRRLVEALRGAQTLSGVAFLDAVFSGRGGVELDLVREVIGALEASPVLAAAPGLRPLALGRALSAGTVFEAGTPGQVELNGWIEASWIEGATLVVAGCHEGALPASTAEHPFLPDSARAALGLADNAARLARDACTLACLAAVRPAGGLHLTWSRFDEDGSPRVPSRLLARCPDDELPARIRALYRGLEGVPRPAAPTTAWRWTLPARLRKPPPARIRVTDFAQYLWCPLRFYFTRVLGIEPFDPRAREMDAPAFGTLLHGALEAFAMQARDEENPAAIERCVRGHLDALAAASFGRHPAPAVRVQIEAAKARLRAFAEIQARERADGWRLLDVERSFDGDLAIGPLSLRGKIDRIEEHPERGIRIVDYKTSAKATPPEGTHFGPASRHLIPEALASYRGREKAWMDLQLPLYLDVAARWYPGRMIESAYFLLPEDPSQTGVAPLALTVGEAASARRCAEAVASRVAAGVFWPPRPEGVRGDDPLAPVIVEESGDLGFAEETIEFLRGAR